MVDKMVKIECLLCGGVVKIPTLSNTEQYDGHGICQKCESLLYVKLLKGKVLKYRVVENKSKQAKSLSYSDLAKSAEDLERHPPDLLIETSEKAT